MTEREEVPVRTSAAVLAQVWRDGAKQANLARVLSGVAIAALDTAAGKRVGTLLSRSATTDAVDGHVALLVSTGDRLITSDPDDLAHLLDVRGVQAVVTTV